MVETQRGKGTKLTAFGERLVWAGERMQARLGPQLENLAQELASEIKPFLEQRPSVIRVHASHGFAVAKLREFLDREPGIGVDLRYVSNQHSLVSLAQGACDLSGLHLPRGELRAQGVKACREWLDPREDRVINFVTREMGLMVARGNPLRIKSLRDLVGPKVRFVNRDHDSGTRLLFDQLLALQRIDETRINGAQQIEFTHAAVAAYVASGMADACFGVEAAARHFGLDFIRVLTEDYFFVCKRAFLETEPMQRILDIIRSPDFRKAIATLPGYTRHGEQRQGLPREDGHRSLTGCNSAGSREPEHLDDGWTTLSQRPLISRRGRTSATRRCVLTPRCRLSSCTSGRISMAACASCNGSLKDPW